MTVAHNSRIVLKDYISHYEALPEVMKFRYRGIPFLMMYCSVSNKDWLEGPSVKGFVLTSLEGDARS